jgi:hypothetical protein
MHMNGRHTSEPQVRRSRWPYIAAFAAASLFLAALPEQAVAQCTATAQFGSATAPLAGLTTTISTCNFAGEFSVISSVVAGSNYIVTASTAGTFITVRSGTSAGPVVGFGTTPLNWTAMVSGNHYIHYHTSAACGSASSCMTTTLQNTAPVVVVDPCSPTTPLAACGTTQSVTLSGSGAGWSVASCGFSTPGQERVFTYTPPVTGAYTLSVTSATGGYVDYFWKLASGGCSSSGWTCIDDISSVLTVPIATWTAGVPVLILLDAESTSSRTHVFKVDCTTGPPVDPCSPTTPLADCGTTQSVTLSGLGANWSGNSCGFPTPGQERVYTYTPPVTGAYTLSVTSATGGYVDYFWKLASSGCGPSGWTCIDDVIATGTSPIATWTAGVPVLILLDAEAQATVTQTFGVTCPVDLSPINDLICNATPITCGSTLAGTTVGATMAGTAEDNGDPNQSCGGFYQSTPAVWYSILGDGQQFTASLCATAWDSKIFVYSGTCAAPVCVAGNDDGGPSCSGVNSSIAWSSTVGETYFIKVHSYSGAVPLTNAFLLELTCAPPPAPTNDLVCNAAPVACGSTTAGTTVNATSSGTGETVTCFSEQTTGAVWYSVAGTGLDITAALCATAGWDSRIDVFTGDCSVLTCVGGNDDNGPSCTGTAASFTWATTVGTTYYIRVSGTSGTSAFSLNVSCAGPANDDCADAIAVGCNSITAGSTVAANGADNAGIFCGTSANTSPGVWYTVQGWGGTMNASLCGSTVADTKLAVYTGSCGAFTCVAGNDDACSFQSAVSWTSAPSTTYHIYVYAFSTADPGFTFNLAVSCGDNDPTCTANGLTLEFQTDAAPFETTWEIRNEAGTIVATSGGPLVAPLGVQTENACVPDGCYTLRVLDAAGDGMTTGGYILRTTGTNQRIVDDRNNFSTGSTSAISGGQGFCLPMSSDKLIYTSCDKLDWLNGQYVVASPNAAVSAEWIASGANSVQDANSGYEFWIFDPNGSYSFRRFRSHNQSDGFGPASATRAAHMKLNNWTAASHVPANILMNVRVRARINGVNGAFGPACRLAIDPVLAACPRTKLMDIPGNEFFSCGATRQYGTGKYVHARPVSGANRYQFRFRIPAEGFDVTRTVTTYFVQLNWTGPTALQDGKTYDVDVRVSKDGGLTWCTTADPWGDVCLLTIDNTPANSGDQNFASEATAAELRMFPNPNRGDQLNLSISAVEEGVNTVSVDIFDLFGKRVSARTIAVNDGMINTVLDLNGELAAGLYLVNITAGDTVYTERLVIQP